MPCVVQCESGAESIDPNTWTMLAWGVTLIKQEALAGKEKERHSLPYLKCFRWVLFQQGGPNPVSMVTDGRALDLYVRACVPWASSCTVSQFSTKSTFIIWSHNMLTFYPLLMWCNTLHLSRYRGKICVWIHLCVLQCSKVRQNSVGAEHITCIEFVMRIMCCAWWKAGA